MADKTKKKWYSIVSPTLRNAVIGETLAYEDKSLENRRLDVNLMSITNEPKSQNVKVLLKVDEVKDNKAIASVIGYGLTLSYIKRLIRKEANKIVDSFGYTTKDNVNVVIKPFMITRHKTNKNVLRDIRKTAREFLTEETKKYDYNELINIIVSNSLQRSLRERVSKIYPLSSCEFRIVKRV